MDTGGWQGNDGHTCCFIQSKQARRMMSTAAVRFMGCYVQLMPRCGLGVVDCGLQVRAAVNAAETGRFVGEVLAERLRVCILV